ncbi:prostate androgen-regulated mucin-like protein 1 isoform X2 [Nycticebus coucang]|nr:prostate androgen-regulated mucin-like protein 1 isoform X2 [Nycticebus coucang]XP_053439427.1 prostate androgen-regulated mucin-like protein 1 isoform X2 [Nycticebus coucang]
MEKIAPSTTIWTSFPQNTAAATAAPTNGTHGDAVLSATASDPTSPLPKNVSVEPREEEPSSPAPSWKGPRIDPSPPGLQATSSGGHLTATPEERSSGPPEASVPATAPRVPAEPPTLTSSQAPASSLPSSPSASAPAVSSPSFTADHSPTETSAQPTGAPTTPESPTEEPTPGHAPTSHASVGPVFEERTPLTPVSSKAMCELIDMETTTTFPRVIMREVEHALSSGSIAAITVTVIAGVLLVFGVAAYLKIRHSAYGRLLDDHDYGSWGNYNNPLYDDS